MTNQIQATVTREEQATLANDVVGSLHTGEITPEQLDGWVSHNIVHAMESCPTVFAEWQRRFFTTKGLLARIAAAYEHLDEDAKIAVLNGDNLSKAARYVAKNIVRDDSYWKALSPAWIGPAGSALREKAVSMRWHPVCLGEPVGRGLLLAEKPAWTQWVPYPHSVAVFGRVIECKKNKKDFDDRAILGNLDDSELKKLRDKYATPPLVLHGPPWADPLDVCMAQHLLRSFETHVPLEYTLHVHPEVKMLRDEDNERVRGMIKTYSALGLWKEFRDYVMSGDPILRQYEESEMFHAPGDLFIAP